MGPLALTLTNKIRGVLSRSNTFLRNVTGVIHVGANAGQERELYDTYHLNVAWVEPIPSVFTQLCSNLAGFPKQRAYSYLITDKDEQEYTFHIADNEGASSSILPLARHREMWPEISYTNDITLKSITLNTFVKKAGLNLAQFQALVLDTQGSELLILKGAGPILPMFRFVKVEVPDFMSYEGCCQVDELNSFMKANGFRERRRDAFKTIPGLGTYFDVLYQRVHAEPERFRADARSLKES